MFRLALVPMASFALAGTSMAGVIEMDFQNVSPGHTVHFTLTSEGIVNQATNAGVFNWLELNGPNSTFGLPVDGSGNFDAFCIELLQTVGGGAYFYNEDALSNAPDPSSAFSPMGVALANRIGRLFTVYYADGSGTAADRAAAMQVAIWETIYEPAGFNATSGNFFISEAGIAAKANAYLAAQSSVNRTGAFALTHELRQDMVVVPTPGSLVLIGLSGLVTARRRRA